MKDSLVSEGKAGPAAAAAEPSRSTWLWTLLATLPFAVVAIHPLANNDLPMHLAIGEWVLDHGRIPAEDPFAAVRLAGAWVAHEWLAGVIFAVSHAVGGPTALVLLTAGLSAVSIAGAHRLAIELGATPFSATSAAAAAVFVIGPRVMARPHLFFLAIVPWLAWLLVRARSGRSCRALWCLPVATLVWAHVHGSYLLGVAAVVGDLLIFGRGHAVPLRTRAIVASLTLAVVVVQPAAIAFCDPVAGIRHATDPPPDPVFSAEIREWRSPFSSAVDNYRTTVAWIVLLALTAAAGLGAFIHRSRIPASYLVATGAAFVLFGLHQRFAALAVLLALPLVAHAIHRLSASRRGRARAEAVVLTLLTTLILGAFGLPMDRTTLRPVGLGWQQGPRRLPHDEVEILRELGAKGAVLCEYEYGGVVAWRGFPDLKPSMDSRNSVYGRELYTQHRALLEVATHPRPEVDAAILATFDSNAREKVEANLRIYDRAVEDLETRLDGAVAVLIRDPRVDRLRAGLYEKLTRDARFDEVRKESRSAKELGPILFLRVR